MPVCSAASARLHARHVTRGGRRGQQVGAAFESTDRLAQYPLSGRVVPEIDSSEFRELVYQHAYRIIYRVEKSKVSILTVRNFGRKLDTSDLTSTDE